MVQVYQLAFSVVQFFFFVEFEFLIGKTGAIETTIKEDPRPAIKDKMFADLASTNDW
jgi:hypothetical protein